MGVMVFPVLAAGGILLWWSAPWVPPPVAGSTHIIVDKWRNRLFLYSGDGEATRYPVATGRTTGRTPEGRFPVARKLRLSPGSHNPQLGSYWLGLGVPEAKDGSKFGIHGTNDPSSIGRHLSGGCIRMFNQDIAAVYDRVEVGTLVEIRPFPPGVKQIYDFLQRRTTASRSVAPVGPGAVGCD